MHSRQQLNLSLITYLSMEDAIITERGDVFANILDCANVDGVLNDIEAVTIPEETLENNLDDPNAKIIGDIEAVSIKEEVFENISNEVNEKTAMDSNDNFDQEAEWSKLIKPCYLKLARIDQQKQANFNSRKPLKLCKEHLLWCLFCLLISPEQNIVQKELKTAAF